LIVRLRDIFGIWIRGLAALGHARMARIFVQLRLIAKRRIMFGILTPVEQALVLMGLNIAPRRGIVWLRDIIGTIIVVI